MTPSFKRYRGGVVVWKNTYGKTRYQPVVYATAIDESETGERYTLQKWSNWVGGGKLWKEPNPEERPALYFTRKRAKRKAWGKAAKLELNQWKRA